MGELAPSWAAGAAGMEKMKQTVPTEAVGCIIDCSQEVKTEIRLETKHYANVRRKQHC